MSSFACTISFAVLIALGLTIMLDSQDTQVQEWLYSADTQVMLSWIVFLCFVFLITLQYSCYHMYISLPTMFFYPRLTIDPRLLLWIVGVCYRCNIRLLVKCNASMVWHICLGKPIVIHKKMVWQAECMEKVFSRHICVWGPWVNCTERNNIRPVLKQNILVVGECWTDHWWRCCIQGTHCFH